MGHCLSSILMQWCHTLTLAMAAELDNDQSTPTCSRTLLYLLLPVTIWESPGLPGSLLPTSESILLSDQQYILLRPPGNT